MSYFTEKGWTERSVFELLNDEDGSIFEAGDLLVVDSDIGEDSARFKLKDYFNQYQQPYSNWIDFNNLKYIGELAEQCEKFEECNSNEACVNECKFKEKDVSNKYKVGDLVEVVDKQHGHNFKIGDVVVIEEIDDNYSYKCSNLDKSEYWWFEEDEFKPYKKVSDVAKQDANQVSKQDTKPEATLRTAEDYRKLTPETKIEVVIDGYKEMIPLIELLMIARLSGNVINSERPSTLFWFFDKLFCTDDVDPEIHLETDQDTRFTNLDDFLDKYFTGSKKLEIEKEMQDKLDQIEKLRNEVHKLDAELSKYN